MLLLMSTPGPAAMYGATITLLALDILVISVRFYRIKLLKGTFKLEDWLVLPALALNIGMSVAIWYGVSQHAVGYPTPPITRKKFMLPRTPLDQVNAKISINNEVFFIVSSMFVASVSLSKAVEY
ncbi:hypothetical protein F5Y18DRAFT_373827 [Xylariaceae sp. FL1019]|nr:hypothetical protein F5Y18DRAFT_373827 [Xylariaceae sp. FL1019]